MKTVDGTNNGGAATLVFVEDRNRIHNLGTSFDYAAQAGDIPLVIRGEFLYQKDVNQPIVDRGALADGDLVAGLKSEEADFFKYVLGVDVTVMTNLLVSGQFIQFRNLDFVDDKCSFVTQGGATASCSRYTGDPATMTVTTTSTQADENKEFYSLFFSKPFGETQLGRGNNIIIYEEGGGWWNRFDVEYSFSDEIVLTGEINHYWGDEDTLWAIRQVLEHPGRRKIHHRVIADFRGSSSKAVSDQPAPLFFPSTPGKSSTRTRIMKAKENAWADAYADFVLRIRWVIIILLVIATIAATLNIHKLDIRNDPDTLLPPSNRYVATNLYAEHNFGMGNLMVFALKVKEGDIWQPWFINKVQEIHNKLEALPHSRPANFIDIAAQKIKYMGTDENGLVFKRLIPTEGISDDPEKAKEQLAFLREGVKINPVMAPMLVSMWDTDGNRCAFEDYDKDFCVAKAAYIIADYTDEVKEIYLPWVSEVRADDGRIRQRRPHRAAGRRRALLPRLDAVRPGPEVVAVRHLHRHRGPGPVARVQELARRRLSADRGRHDHRHDTGPDGLHRVQADHHDGADAHAAARHRHRTLGAGHAALPAGAGQQRRLLQVGARSPSRHTIIPATLSIVTDMVGFATLATVDISFYKAYAYFGMFGMLTLLCDHHHADSAADDGLPAAPGDV